MVELNEIYIGISINNKKTFLEEVGRLFKDMGFEVKGFGKSLLIEGKKGNSELHANILYIMGLLEDTEVAKVRSVISKAKSFKEISYRVKNRVLALSKKEEMEYYHRHYDGRIEKLIKKHFNTRNSRYYVDKYDVIFALADEIMVSTPYNIFGTSLNDPVMIYIEKNIDRMLRSGVLEQGGK